jgi:hypothetical protein
MPDFRDADNRTVQEIARSLQGKVSTGSPTREHVQYAMAETPQLLSRINSLGDTKKNQVLEILFSGGGDTSTSRVVSSLRDAGVSDISSRDVGHFLKNLDVIDTQIARRALTSAGVNPRASGRVLKAVGDMVKSTASKRGMGILGSLGLSAAKLAGSEALGIVGDVMEGTPLGVGEFPEDRIDTDSAMYSSTLQQDRALGDLNAGMTERQVRGMNRRRERGLNRMESRGDFDISDEVLEEERSKSRIATDAGSPTSGNPTLIQSIASALGAYHAR